MAEEKKTTSDFPEKDPSSPDAIDAGNTGGQLARSSATKLELITASFGFFVAGVNDGSIGALTPYFIRDYGISTAEVSAVHGANFLGWFIAALTNTHLNQYLGLGAMFSLGASLQLIAHCLRPWKPPFPLLVVTYWLASLGQAQQDTLANTFVAGATQNAHRWLAFIHAMYAAGCLCAPFVSTGIASASTPSRWPLFYLCLIGLAIINLTAVASVFRTSLKLRQKSETQGEVIGSAGMKSRNTNAFGQIKKALALRPFWSISLFFFCYLGAAITANGWIVEYLVVVRNGDLSTMGYIPAASNGGMLLGRILLPELAHRFGEREFTFLLTLLSIAFQLVFWLVPNIVAAAIALSLFGFVTGPWFATGVFVASNLLDPEVRGTALGFIFVFAQMGGCLFPIITGVVASRAGVQVLQPILCALLVATAVSWLLVPKILNDKGRISGIISKIIGR